MIGFEFIFALFSLLLGLGMAEIMEGFARVLKLHARARAGLQTDVRVGWLVPLLAIFVLLSQLAFWTITYAIRDQVPFNYVTLVGVTVIVGGYYLLSVLVWPEDPGEWPDFDLYYDRHNRFILVGNLLLSLAAAMVNAIYMAPPTAAQLAARETDAALIAVFGIYGALLLNIVLIFVRRRRLNAALLAVLIALQVGGSIAAVASLG